MWIYKKHSEEDYNKAIEKVEKIAMSYGAEFVTVREQKFTTLIGRKKVQEVVKMRVFKYKDEFFEVEHHYLPDCPFIVFSFGDTIENIFEDAEPFPYNLPDEELELEVRYSLGIENYPE